MKRLYLLIFIALVLGAACAPAVQPTPSPPAEPTLNADEVAVVEFISEHSQEMEDAHDLTYDAIDAGADGRWAKMSNGLLDAADMVDDVVSEWGKIDWTYGATNELEERFNQWLKVEGKYLLALGRVAYRGQDPSKALQLQMKAEAKAEACLECLEDFQ